MSRKDRVILSDNFLKKQHFFKFVKEIKQNAKKVVIIGGSHSGFSCAWMLLNGPANYKLQFKNLKHFPNSKKYANQKCKFCCQCNTENPEQCDLCKCICLGSSFENPEVKFDYQNDLPSNLEIQILYRDKIRVFYSTVGAADDAGYSEYDSKLFPKKTGLLYGFTGLRGDAKDLYTNIVKGRETRIQLIKAETI